MILFLVFEQTGAPPAGESAVLRRARISVADSHSKAKSRQFLRVRKLEAADEVFQLREHWRRGTQFVHAQTHQQRVSVGRWPSRRELTQTFCLRASTVNSDEADDRGMRGFVEMPRSSRSSDPRRACGWSLLPTLKISPCLASASAMTAAEGRFDHRAEFDVVIEGDAFLQFLV